MSEATGPDPQTVFVIHGRNEAARSALFAFLRAIKLHPVEWGEAISMTHQGSPYIGDVLDAAFNAAQAVVVLQTPDDIAYLHPSLAEQGDADCEAQPQPRPNVLYEAGMAMGRDAERTVIVELGQVRGFSDIHGRHVVRLDNTVAKRQGLAHRLRDVGCNVNLDGSDWHSVGDLTPPPPPGGGLPLGRKLPSTKSSDTPQLSARLIAHGGNHFEEVEITNHGPGDVYELDVSAAEEDEIHTRAPDFPVSKLPKGGSVRVMRPPSTVGSNRKSYFTIVVTGKTIDGIPVHEELFVS